MCNCLLLCAFRRNRGQHPTWRRVSSGCAIQGRPKRVSTVDLAGPHVVCRQRLGTHVQRQDRVRAAPLHLISGRMRGAQPSHRKCPRRAPYCRRESQPHCPGQAQARPRGPATHCLSRDNCCAQVARLTFDSCDCRAATGRSRSGIRDHRPGGERPPAADHERPSPCLAPSNGRLTCPVAPVVSIGSPIYCEGGHGLGLSNGRVCRAIKSQSGWRHATSDLSSDPVVGPREPLHL